MATLVSHLKIFAGKEKQFEDVARRMCVHTHREPACRRYEYYRREELGHYFAFEIFDDYAGFVTHLAAPYHNDTNWPSLLEEVRVEWLDPVSGTSDESPTDEQLAPAGADEILRKLYELYRVRVAWWNDLR